MQVEPLPIGRILDERFTIQDLLGRGRTTLSYLAQDAFHNGPCVVKELALPGSIRLADGTLQLPLAPEWNSRARMRFIEEARRAAKAGGSAMPAVRAALAAFGTAYYVSEYFQGAVSMQKLLDSAQTIEPNSLTTVFEAICDAVRRLHDLGLLHRAIRPSNVLQLPDGSTKLVDFGGVQEFLLDHRAPEQTFEDDPYAPPEASQWRARRGPQSDIYRIAATMVALLSGVTPPTAAARAEGVEYEISSDRFPDVPSDLLSVVEFGWRLPFASRPPSVGRWLDDGFRPQAEISLEERIANFDQIAMRLKDFDFQRRQCPSCRTGVLESPKPLALKQCPVCRAGRIKQRKVALGLCPVCRDAPLKTRVNVFPIGVCPACVNALLVRKKRGFFKKEWMAACEECSATFLQEAERWRMVTSSESSSNGDDELKTTEEWTKRAARTNEMMVCSGCLAQFDILPDGRWKQMVPQRTSRYETLLPIEWANVAAGLPPHFGNSECDGCGADFFVEGSSVTLLHIETDPFDSSQSLLDRVLDWESIRWIGVGKDSTHPGFVCADCSCEFDFDAEKLTLIKSSNPRLIARSHESRTLEEWMRIGEGLPLAFEQEAFYKEFEDALRKAYLKEELDFASHKRGALIWQGPAELGEGCGERFEGKQQGALSITDSEIVFGGIIRKQRYDLAELRDVALLDDQLELSLEGESLCLRIEPVEMLCPLESGVQRVRMTSNELYERLRRIVDRRLPATSTSSE